jgi:hypothetical protein
MSALPNTSRYSVPADCICTDRVLLRWAVSIGDGTGNTSWFDLPRGGLTALDDQTAIVVDQLILRSPRFTRKVTELWYRSPAPREAIAKRLGCRLSYAYDYWADALVYFRGHFRDSPLSNLRNMVAMDVVADDAARRRKKLSENTCISGTLNIPFAY